LDRFKPFDFEVWLKGLEDKPNTNGHLKAFMNRLFNKAKLFGMVDFHENPIGLVEVRGISKRSKKPVVLTIEQIFMIHNLLPESYRTMTLLAQCTGLRVEEILALDWAKGDFNRLCINIEEAVVHGRLGPVKSEYSGDELPLDPRFRHSGAGMEAGHQGWQQRSVIPQPHHRRVLPMLHRCCRNGSGGRVGAWWHARTAAPPKVGGATA
jgi:integrase